MFWILYDLILGNLISLYFVAILFSVLLVFKRNSVVHNRVLRFQSNVLYWITVALTRKLYLFQMKQHCTKNSSKKGQSACKQFDFLPGQITKFLWLLSSFNQEHPSPTSLQKLCPLNLTIALDSVIYLPPT